MSEVERAGSADRRAELGRGLRNLVPELGGADSFDTASRSPDARCGLIADQGDRVVVQDHPSGHVRHVPDIVPRHGHRHRRSKTRSGFAADGSNHSADLVAERHEVDLAGGGAESIAAPLRRVHVERDLGQPRFDQSREEARVTAERVAVRHDHRNHAQRLCEGDDRAELRRVAKRDFSVGDLDVALGSQIGA